MPTENIVISDIRNDMKKVISTMGITFDDLLAVGSTDLNAKYFTEVQDEIRKQGFEMFQVKEYSGYNTFNQSLIRTTTFKVNQHLEEHELIEYLKSIHFIQTGYYTTVEYI